jgi:hypothetical protein
MVVYFFLLAILQGCFVGEASMGYEPWQGV